MGKQRNRPATFPERPEGGTPLSQWASGNNAQRLAKRGEVLNLVTMLIRANDQRKSLRWRIKRWLQQQWFRTKVELHQLGLWVNVGTPYGRSRTSVMDPEMLRQPQEEEPAAAPPAEEPPGTNVTLA